MKTMTAKKAAETRRQVISFRLGTELLGFDLKYVQKVIEVEELSFVPRTPSFVRGAISIHGKVIAVVDLKEFFGMEKTELSVDTRVLVIASEAYNLGLLVDRVERIESVPLRGTMVRSPEPGDVNPNIMMIINLGGRIFNMIDVEKLMLEIENFFE